MVACRRRRAPVARCARAPGPALAGNSEWRRHRPFTLTRPIGPCNVPSFEVTPGVEVGDRRASSGPPGLLRLRQLQLLPARAGWTTYGKLTASTRLAPNG